MGNRRASMKRRRDAGLRENRWGSPLRLRSSHPDPARKRASDCPEEWAGCGCRRRPSIGASNESHLDRREMAVHRRGVQRVAQRLVDLLDSRSHEHRLGRGILPGLGVHRIGGGVHRIGQICLANGWDLGVGEWQVQRLLVYDRVHRVQIRGVELSFTFASEGTF